MSILTQCHALPRRLGRGLRYILWVLSGRLGFRIRLGSPARATALIVYYSPARARHLRTQVRNLLRCAFIDRVVTVSHNPDLDLAPYVAGLGDRVTAINSCRSKGCGGRWTTARALNADYLIVIDDDMLLFPRQIAGIFSHLTAMPEALHGVSGMAQMPDGGLEYHDREDLTVDFLCEVYALTAGHLRRYAELEGELAQSPSLAQAVESCADFIVVSRSGSVRPRIHNVGHLFRCSTHKQEGLAVHQRVGFRETVLTVVTALQHRDPAERVQSQTLPNSAACDAVASVVK
jgi:hypothetical protein